MKGSNIGKSVEYFRLPETGKGYNCVCLQVWGKAKDREQCCMLHLCVSQSTYLHIWMTAASPALHVVDMANIKQMLLIPQSTLRLSVSLTSVHVCCLSVDYFITAVPCVCSWQCVCVCVCVCEKLLFMRLHWINEGKCEYSCMHTTEA